MNTYATTFQVTVRYVADNKSEAGLIAVALADSDFIGKVPDGVFPPSDGYCVGTIKADVVKEK